MLKYRYPSPETNSAMGDRGIAMKTDSRFDGDRGQNKKFEGLAPAPSDSARLAQQTGRQ